MEKINYLTLLDLVATKITEEERQVDAEDFMFVSYLKDLAMIDDTVNDKEFRTIETVYELFEDEYNESIKDDPMYFTIEII